MEKRKPRKKISADVEASLLIQSRRRCCICFGLEGDLQIKPGQIAHLDKDRQNNKLANLAYLCFPHHDEYDSSTSQRKNYTMKEVKHYRTELAKEIQHSWGVSKEFKQRAKGDSIVGQYIRVGIDGLSAQLLISLLLDGRYHISGAAFQGPQMHHGFLEFTADLEESRIIYEESFEDLRDGYRIQLDFVDGLALVSDSEESHPDFGAFVRFDGTYRKTGGLGIYESVF